MMSREYIHIKATYFYIYHLVKMYKFKYSNKLKIYEHFNHRDKFLIFFFFFKFITYGSF